MKLLSYNGLLYYHLKLKELITQILSQISVQEKHILYNSAETNFGDITLNDSLQEYEYIEVYGKTNDGIKLYTKVDNPDNSQFCLSTVNIFVNDFHKTKIYLCADDKIKVAYNDDGTPMGGRSFV